MGRRKISQLNKNAGFSLVELLISVTILAIIVIPLLHMFVTSSKINIKSRTTLRATTVAQDIMEGLKAYDIDELKAQFNNPTEGFYVINDSIIKGGMREDTAREEAEVGTGTDGTTNPGYYCFVLEGVTMQGSEYDALIMVDGRGYQTVDGTNGSHTANQANMGVDGVTPKAHNNDGFAAVTAIDESKDGVYAEKAEFAEEILERIRTTYKDEFEADGIEPADVTFKTSGLTVSRSYTVNISDGGTDTAGNPVADVEVKAVCECGYNGESRTVDVSDLIHDRYASFISGNYYFLYYPLYAAIDEEIEINNAADIPLNLTIAKQIYASEDSTDPYVLSDSQLNAAEKNYHICVNISGGSLNQTQIRTNLGTNLTNSKYLDGEGENSDLPGQVKFTYNNAVSKMNIFTLSGVRNTSLGAEGTDGELTEVIYDVTVEVYKAGAADKDFPQEDRMVSIDGSKNN